MKALGAVSSLDIWLRLYIIDVSINGFNWATNTQRADQSKIHFVSGKQLWWMKLISISINIEKDHNERVILINSIDANYEIEIAGSPQMYSMSMREFLTFLCNKLL